MALPVTERMQSFRDPEVRRTLSIEAVETEGTHSYQAARGTRVMSFNRRWDLVQVYMGHPRAEPEVQWQERRANSPGARERGYGRFPGPGPGR